MPQPTPTKIPEPFAVNAGPSFINTIPLTTSTPGKASYDQGFPADTMTAPAAGGIPPFGPDFNGLLNQMTAGIAALQAGQLSAYDSGYATAIGGYAVGAVVAMADGSGLWMSTAAANTTNPDTGGAGWITATTYGVGSSGSVTGGTVTLTAGTYKKSVVFLAGALTSNAQIVFPTASGQQWLVVNQCTGAFTVTARTSAGTGVAIPAGGASSPTGVYCDGANIQLSTTPLTVAISVSPTPSTLVERDNTGNVLGKYFNGNTALENPTVGAVIVQNSGADGFFRKMSLANFIKNALGVSVSLGVNGHLSMFGLTMNWGKTGASSGAPQTITYDAAYATQTYVVVCTATPTNGTINVSAETASGFTMTNGASGVSTFWISLGDST